MIVDRERDDEQHPPIRYPTDFFNDDGIDTEADHVPASISSTIDKAARIRGASHLVVVAGHAIWAGCNATTWEEEQNWVLHEYQKGGGSVDAFFKHIVRGWVISLLFSGDPFSDVTLINYSVEIARADPSAILIFSGGITRASHPFQSEAQSYLQLAAKSGLLDSPKAAQSAKIPSEVHAFTEDYALDSFQNLLFAIARFHEVTLEDPRHRRRPAASDIVDVDEEEGAWPSKITVVGFEMKRKRFEDLHRKALRFPKGAFRYVGVDASSANARKEGWDGEVCSDTPLKLGFDLVY